MKEHKGLSHPQWNKDETKTHATILSLTLIAKEEQRKRNSC